jgi:hypothetical protein
LYSLRQKFFSFVVLNRLGLQTQARSRNILELERAELLVYDLPDDFVGGHDDSSDGVVKTIETRY